MKVMKKTTKAPIFASFLLILSAVATSGGLTIAMDRLPGGVWWTNWSTGVVGGIPNVTTIYTNLSPSGNDFLNIQTAVANCPSNQVVYLEAGTYDLTNRPIIGAFPIYWLGGK